MICCKYAARLAVVSNVVAWASGAWAAADLESNPVNEEGIVISLPVYVVSLIATATFTWTIAKYDSARNRRLDLLEAELIRSTDRLEEILRNESKR